MKSAGLPQGYTVVVEAGADTVVVVVEAERVVAVMVMVFTGGQAVVEMGLSVVEVVESEVGVMGLLVVVEVGLSVVEVVESAVEVTELPVVDVAVSEDAVSEVVVSEVTGSKVRVTNVLMVELAINEAVELSVLVAKRVVVVEGCGLHGERFFRRCGWGDGPGRNT